MKIRWGMIKFLLKQVTRHGPSLEEDMIQLFKTVRTVWSETFTEDNKLTQEHHLQELFDKSKSSRRFPMRSFYLNNSDWSPGDLILCKAITPDTTMTPGKIYVVLNGGHIINDLGEIILPNVRFTFYKKENQ